jgi:cytochrome c553
LKIVRLSLLALASAAFAVAVSAQAPQGAPPAGGAPPKFTPPPPTNLQVLPKNLTGEQVHDIMEAWEGALGAHCNTCHAVDPTRKRPDGRPMLNFADDSRPEKQIARKMFQMTEEINKSYISKVDNSGEAVTCGTCHRGHLGPEHYNPPPEEHGPPPPPPAK